MKKGCNPYTKDNFPKQLTYRRCRVATSPRSKNFEAPTKLPNESVQKLPWEGGGVATFFQLFILVPLFIHIMSSCVFTFHPLCNFPYILHNISQ